MYAIFYLFNVLAILNGLSQHPFTTVLNFSNSKFTNHSRPDSSCSLAYLCIKIPQYNVFPTSRKSVYFILKLIIEALNVTVTTVRRVDLKIVINLHGVQCQHLSSSGTQDMLTSLQATSTYTFLCPPISTVFNFDGTLSIYFQKQVKNSYHSIHS